jgi:hypothetical protein
VKGVGRGQILSTFSTFILRDVREPRKPKGSLGLGRDSKGASPEYESEALPLEALCSVLQGNVTCIKYCHDLGACGYRRGVEW